MERVKRAVGLFKSYASSRVPVLAFLHLLTFGRVFAAAAHMHRQCDANRKDYLSNVDGFSLVLLAAQCNCVPVLKYLTGELGADVNLRGENEGETALIIAAKNNSVELARAITSISSASIDTADEGGWTPTRWAESEGNDEIVDVIREAREGLDDELLDYACDMCQGVEIKDRKYRLKKYKKCFLGTEAFAWMCAEKRRKRSLSLAPAKGGTDEERILGLGDAMIRRGLMQHVLLAHMFRNKKYFYRFSSEVHKRSGVSQEQRASEAQELLRQMSIDSKGSSDRDTVSQAQIINNNCLYTLASRLRGCVSVRNRRYRLKLYQKCFLGNEAVDALARFVSDDDTGEERSEADRKRAVQDKKIRAEALSVGQQLVDHGFIEHVCSEHGLKDERLFYRFTRKMSVFDNRVVSKSRGTLISQSSCRSSRSPSPSVGGSTLRVVSSRSSRSVSRVISRVVSRSPSPLPPAERIAL